MKHYHIEGDGHVCLWVVIVIYMWLYRVMGGYMGYIRLWEMCSYVIWDIICVDLKISMQTWLELKLYDVTNYNTIKHHLHA